MEDENKDAHLEGQGPDATKGEGEDPQDPGKEIINPKDPIDKMFLVDLPERIVVT